MTLDPSDAQSDAARLQRLQETMRDLANRQEDLRRQLAAVVDLLEAELDAADDVADNVDEPPPAAPPSRRFGADPGRSALGRARSAVKHRVLGPVIARGRALWRASRRIAPPSWSASDEAPARLRLGEDVVSLRARSCGDWPPGVEALALHTMAVEGLGFVRLLGPRVATGTRWDDLDWILVRPDLIDRETDDGVPRLRLDHVPLDRPAGKTVFSFGDAEPDDVPPFPGGDELATVGPWAFHPKARRPPRASLALGTLPVDTQPTSTLPTRTEPPTTAIVLTHPLVGGLERFVARLLRAETRRPTIVAQMATEGPIPAHPTVDLAALGATIWPLAEWVARSHRDVVLRQLLRRHRVDRIVHVGPGDGIFDSPDDDLRELLRTARLVDLPTRRFPATEPIPRRDGWVDVRLVTADAPASDGSIRLPVDPEAPPTPAIGPADAARRRLGLDIADDERLVVWLGDLVPEQRPEDAVALAARLRDRPIHVLMVGRGPAAASIDDLSRHLAPPRLRRSTWADPADLLAAADAVVTTDEAVPFPWWPHAARLAGLAVVDGAEAGTVEELARRIEAAVDEPARGEPRGEPEADDAWLRSIVDGSTPD